MDPIEEVKRRIDIVEYINVRVPLKKAGRNFKVLCPFHSEKTPSFIVSPERQIWYCFGACNEGGDIFKFVQKYENLEFREALEELARVAGVEVQDTRGSKGRFEEKKRLLAINHLTSEFYHYLLTKHKVGEKARGYLRERKINDDSIKLFKLGYAPNQWDGLYQYLVERKKYQPRDVEAAGLIVFRNQGVRGSRNLKIKRQRDYYDRFRGRLMFPLKDHRGKLVGFAGRLLDLKAHEAPLRQDFEGQAKYINTPETLLYHKGELLYGLDLVAKKIREEGFAVMVEGEIDMIASFQAGVKNVVALKGSALTLGQLKLLKRYTENLRLALDADLTGDEAARRGIELAENEGFNLRVIRLPKGKDPDECVRADIGAWRKAVNEAVPVYDFIIDSLRERVIEDELLSESEKKKKVANEAALWLTKISNLVVRAHYVRILAEVLGVGEEVVERLVEEVKSRVGQRDQVAQVTREETLEKKNREEVLADYLLALVLQTKVLNKAAMFLEENFQLNQLPEGSVKKIIESLGVGKGKTGVTKKPLALFIESLPEHLKGVADRAFLRQLAFDVENEKVFFEELGWVVVELKRIDLKKRLGQVGELLKKTKKSEEMAELNQKFMRLSRQLVRMEKS